MLKGGCCEPPFIILNLFFTIILNTFILNIIGLGMKSYFNKFFLFLFLIAIFPLSSLFAQNNWICPGIKLGYRFDDGFVFGFEVSYVNNGNGGFFGGLLAYDYCPKTRLNKFNISVEGGSIIGVAIGPSFIMSDIGNSFGITSTVYTGYFLMPYINYDLNFTEKSNFEIGSYVKFYGKVHPIKL